MKQSKNTKKNSKNFLKHASSSPVLIGIATGLYPLVFYYSRNFGMINSWQHLGYFLIFFLLFPIVLFSFLKWFSKLSFLGKWGKYVIPFFNVFVFFFFIKIILFASVERKIIVGIFIIAALISYFLHKYFKKCLTIQLLLAVIGFIGLVPILINYLNYSSEWMKQPDNIEDVVFQKKPNVYYIQPDGYVNFSELNRGYYNSQSSHLEDFLLQNNFINYQNFRSNYDATLSSNSSTFMMKHHYYSGSSHSSEVTNARNIIITHNAVLNIFKSNNYKTYFFTEFPYLMMNRPKMGYDYSNFTYSEIPFVGTGLETKKNILPDLKQILGNKENDRPKFFFIEVFNPKHIDGSNEGKNLVLKKRNQYFENVEKANETIKDMVKNILKNDPRALILIMADHGGYVGMTQMQQGNIKTSDRNKIFSIFSSMLSIHWPNGQEPKFDYKFKTSVNVFRIIFSYLSEDTSYLKHLQEDISYGYITEKTTKGVYELIDENDSITFKTVKTLK